MSEIPVPSSNPIFGAYHLLGPKYLNLPALLPHIPIVVLSAVFYQFVYSVFAPLLHLVLIPNPQLKPTKLSRHFWNAHTVSIAQSCVNTALAIYLLSHTQSRNGLTPQERILGYDRESARVLAVSMGYFVFHLGDTWVHRHIWGISMFIHGVCALFAVSLGFRPLALHYTATFLIWELPNILLNIQRQMGDRKNWIRTVNRMLLLSTYATVRLGFGTISLIRMAHDMVVTARDPHLRVGAEHIVPYLLKVSDRESQAVRRLPVLLAFIQLGSMVLLHVQGFYWFAKIARKGDLIKKK